MPFRQAFDCLWCGRAHQTRSTSDLEGWASLCSDCIGRAGENGFLRYRLRAAIEERAKGSRSPATLDAEMKAYYAARAPEYDDAYTRTGRYSEGPVLDMAWHRELDEATLWLDATELRGEIVELAAGTGWWSPLLAQKGELSLYDVNPEPLDRARERLVAHGLRAHLHVRDAWTEPDRQVDAVFCGFWLSHITRDRIGEFLRLVARWLKADGTFVFIDEQGAPPGAGSPSTDEIEVRRLADGREFHIPKVAYTAEELADALREAGFQRAAIGHTARYFLMGIAER